MTETSSLKQQASLVTSIFIGAAIFITGALMFRFPEVQELKNLRK